MGKLSDPKLRKKKGGSDVGCEMEGEVEKRSSERLKRGEERLDGGVGGG